MSTDIPSIRRVVLVAPAGMGGIQVWCLDYARELKKRSEIEATVLFEDNGVASGAAMRGNDVATEVFSYGPLDNRSRVCQRLEKRFLHGVDAVYPNTSGMAYQALAHLGPKRPVAIAGCRGDFEHDYGLITRFSPWMDGIFAVSEMCAERLRRRLASNVPPVVAIPHGIQPAEARPLPSGPLRLLFTGRLDPVKRLGDILEVAAKLKERGVDFGMEIVGDGPERPGLESLARRTGVEDRVTFAGGIAPGEVARRIDECHALLLLSERESFGRSALEAMARGRVVVVTNTCGCREAVRDGQNGFLVSPGESNRVAEILSRLDSNREGLARIGEAALRTVTTDYHPDGIYGRHRTLLESCARRHEERRQLCVPAPYGFSRLDAPWIPDWATRMARRAWKANRRCGAESGGVESASPKENGIR